MGERQAQSCKYRCRDRLKAVNAAGDRLKAVNTAGDRLKAVNTAENRLKAVNTAVDRLKAVNTAENRLKVATILGETGSESKGSELNNVGGDRLIVVKYRWNTHRVMQY